MSSEKYPTSSTLKKVFAGELFEFVVSDEEISKQISSIHDLEATKFDVDSLYTILENIIRNSNEIRERDLQRLPTIELVEDKLPNQNILMPPASTLKQISFQMTIKCKSFDATTTHQMVMEILEKLRGYNWDAKASIALAAFALDYGQCLHQVSAIGKKMQIFRFGGMKGFSYFNDLVESALQFVKDIIELEKSIAIVQGEGKDISAWIASAPRDIYTYWAILALVVGATQRDNDAEVMTKLNLILVHLKIIMGNCSTQKALIDDYIMRLKTFQYPSGIMELLRALISPADQYPEIYDNTSKEKVSNDVLKKKNFLLFMNGLEDIEDDILDLKPIDDAFRTDVDKQDYMILWIPVVEDWSESQMRKFESKYEDLKSLMPWYVLNNFSLIKGIKLLKEEWGYQNKTMVVVTNPQGKVINKNAIHMIYRYQIDAFPFRPEDEESISTHWRWFWNEVEKLNPIIQKSVYQNKYIFFYGGTNSEMIKSLATKLNTNSEDMERDEYNMGGVDPDKKAQFWGNINSFHNKIVNNPSSHPVLDNVKKLLSMENEAAWLLLSKGPYVLAVDHYKLWW